MKFRTVAFASTAAVVAAVAIGSGAAQATSLITGKDVKDGSIHRVDLGAGINHRLDRMAASGAQGPQGLPGKDGLNGKDGAPGQAGKDGLNGKNGAQGLPGKDGLNGKDGAPGQAGKDGVTDLNAGANYRTTWVGDSGASLQTVISKCDAGQVAVGGGFSTWGGSDANESGLAYDLGGDNKDIQVTVSAPYTGQAYDESKYHGGILPDRWVVKGYNNGSTDQIVRAWVICANAS
jgi:hypothetical protein